MSGGAAGRGHGEGEAERGGRGQATRGPDVGRRIRERRILLGLTQRRVAELVGVTYKQVPKYEAGINRILAGQSKDFMTHRVLGERDIPGFENVANLDGLPPTGATVVALLMKIAGGSGGPLRIVAFVPNG